MDPINMDDVSRATGNSGVERAKLETDRERMEEI
jgi:hypothetical protein